MLWKRDHAGVTGRVCDSLADRQVSSYSRPRLFLPDECWLLLWACDGSVTINNLCWLGWRLSHLVLLVVEKELEPKSLGESCCVFTLLPRSLFQNPVSVAGSAANTLICECISHLKKDNILHLRMNTNTEKYHSIPEMSNHCWWILFATCVHCYDRFLLKAEDSRSLHRPNSKPSAFCFTVLLLDVKVLKGMLQHWRG